MSRLLHVSRMLKCMIQDFDRRLRGPRSSATCAPETSIVRDWMIWIFAASKSSTSRQPSLPSLADSHTDGATTTQTVHTTAIWRNIEMMQKSRSSDCQVSRKPGVLAPFQVPLCLIDFRYNLAMMPFDALFQHTQQQRELMMKMPLFDQRSDATYNKQVPTVLLVHHLTFQRHFYQPETEVFRIPSSSV